MISPVNLHDRVYEPYAGRTSRFPRIVCRGWRLHLTEHRQREGPVYRGSGRVEDMHLDQCLATLRSGDVSALKAPLRGGGATGAERLVVGDAIDAKAGMRDADDVRATPARLTSARDERPREDTFPCRPRLTLRASVSGISLRPLSAGRAGRAGRSVRPLRSLRALHARESA